MESIREAKVNRFAPQFFSSHAQVETTEKFVHLTDSGFQWMEEWLESRSLARFCRPHVLRVESERRYWPTALMAISKTEDVWLRIEPREFESLLDLLARIPSRWINRCLLDRRDLERLMTHSSYSVLPQVWRFNEIERFSEPLRARIVHNCAEPWMSVLLCGSMLPKKTMNRSSRFEFWQVDGMTFNHSISGWALNNCISRSQGEQVLLVENEEILDSVLSQDVYGLAANHQYSRGPGFAIFYRDVFEEVGALNMGTQQLGELLAEYETVLRSFHFQTRAIENSLS